MSTIRLRIEKTTQEVLYSDLEVPEDADLTRAKDWIYTSKLFLYTTQSGEWKEIRIETESQEKTTWDTAMSMVITDDHGEVTTINAPSFNYAVNDGRVDT